MGNNPSNFQEKINVQFEQKNFTVPPIIINKKY